MPDEIAIEIDTCPQESVDDRAAASAREGEDHGAIATEGVG